MTTSITIATSLDRKYVAAIEKMLGHPIPPMQIETDAERAASFHRGRAEREHGEAEPAHEHRERHQRGRGERHPRRSAPAETPAQEPAAQAENSAAVAPEPSHHDRPRAEQPRNDRPRAEQPHRDRHASRDDDRRPRRDDRRRDRQRDDEGSDAPVLGLGDHVPAFLLRAVKIPSG